MKDIPQWRHNCYTISQKINLWMGIVALITYRLYKWANIKYFKHLHNFRPIFFFNLRKIKFLLK